MELVPVMIGGGKLNYKSRSYVMSVFVVEPPFSRVFANKHHSAIRTYGGRAHGGSVDEPYDPVRGGLFHNDLTFPEGTVLMVQMSSSVGGVRNADAAVFYAVREQAPLVSVRASIVVPAGFNPPANTHLFFGHADRLTVLDLYARKIVPGASFIEAHTSTEEIDELLIVEQIGAAATPMPAVVTIENKNGESVTISVPAVVRRMRIRRKAS